MAQERGTERADDSQPEARDGDDRESIWSILSKYKRWYFGLFSGQIVVAAIWLTQRAIADQSLPGIADKILSVWQNMAPVAISSAAIALALTDIWGTMMVIASWLEDELKKRRQRQIKAAVEKAVEEASVNARTEGRAEGFEQASRRWEEWNRRREAAAAAGEKFDEPPPGMETGINGRQQEE